MSRDTFGEESEAARRGPRGKPATALEKPRTAIPPELAIQLVDHRSHASFVGFPRAVRVEIAQAGDGTGNRGKNRADVIVENEFRLAIEIERRLVFGRLAEILIRSVDGCARGVHQWNFLLDRETQHAF